MNIFQIDNISNNNTSLSKVLLIFYLLIATNFTDNLVSKQLKEYINNNRLVQHFIALLSLLVLITSIGGVVDSRKAILYTIIGYTWFLFTTKLDIQWNIIILLILLYGYLYENSLEKKRITSLNDKSLTEEDINRIEKNNNYIKSIIVLTAISVTIIGTLFYSNKKQIQYGGGYSFIKYLLY